MPTMGDIYAIHDQRSYRAIAEPYDQQFYQYILQN